MIEDWDEQEYIEELDSEPVIEWREVNGEVRECRTLVACIVECEKCGNDVELEAETESWTQGDDGEGRWEHEDYGPAMGECCGLLYADWWEGTFVFELPSAATLG